MASKRNKKKKQKQLAKSLADQTIKNSELTEPEKEDVESDIHEAEEVNESQETSVTEETAEDTSADEKTVEDEETSANEEDETIQTADETEFSEKQNNFEADSLIFESETDEEPEPDEGEKDFSETEQLIYDEQEKEEFAVMMRDFKTAVEHVKEKDPDEETLIRLFGECDTDSLKEKVIENPYEIIEKDPVDIPRLISKLLYVASAVFFAGILSVFGIISFFDKDKLISESENRTLAQRPDFSVSALFSGKYTVDFENYYSDNFPARDFFIGANGKIKNLLTRFSLGESTDVIISVDKSDDDFAGEGVDLGNSSQQESDGMKENTAAVTPDDKATIKGSIIVSGNRAMEIYTYREKDAVRYASVINKTAAAMPDGVKFYSLVAPTAVEFYGTKTYREGIHSQRDAIKNIYSKLSKDVISVDAYSSLVDKSDEYIYFRTDHHWTARGAYYAYTSFCNTAGVTAEKIDSFVIHNIDGFVGSLYRSSQADVLKKNPDYVECFELIVDATNTVYSTPEMTDGINTYIVAKKVNADNKYLAFISGDQPIEKIKTNVLNGKKIAVLKESFGNAFVPFLCNNYEEIYVIDPRKVDLYLPDFVADNGIQEVLAINYCFGISNSKYCNELEKLTVKEAEK